MGGCVINLRHNAQESTGKLGQEPVSPPPNTVSSLVLWFSLPTAFHVPGSVSLMESSNLMSVLKGGKFQLIPGITSLLFPSTQCCLHFLWNFFSGSTNYCSLA